MSAKEAAKRLLEQARSQHVRLPTVWDDSKAMQSCGAILMLHRTADGFNEDAALTDLVTKYGLSESASAVEKAQPFNKRKAEDSEISDDNEEEADDEEGGKKKKVKKAPAIKKTEIVAVEENRPLAAAIQEIAKIAFENKDARKGGVFAKAAKAIRECDFAITCAKDAMKLKGVGKGIAGYVEEQIQTGSIKKLEEMRAGIA